MSESLWDTKALGRDFEVQNYSTESLRELRTVLVEEIQAIDAQLATTFAPDFPRGGDYKCWKKKAIGAKNFKLQQLRTIKRELGDRHTESNSLPLPTSIRILIEAVSICDDLSDDEKDAITVCQKWLALKDGGQV